MHCGQVMAYGNIHLGQHWLRLWLVAWWHQAITWTNVDVSSLAICAVQFYWKCKVLHRKIPLGNVISRYFSNVPGGCELTYVMVYVWLHLFHSDRSEILAGRCLWKRDSHISLGIVSVIFFSTCTITYWIYNKLYRMIKVGIWASLLCVCLRLGWLPMEHVTNDTRKSKATSLR